MTGVAVIGDGFMRAAVFEDALLAVCGDAVTCRRLDLAWPDAPVEHGHAGLGEYMGTAEEVIRFAQGATVLVTHLAPVSRAVFAALPELALVAVARGGPVNVDMAAARAHGVPVVNAPGRNASAVAEFTIAAILAQTRSITRGHDALRRGIWEGALYRADHAGEELCDLSVGVVGYGHVGTRVVRLLRAFGARVLVCDPYVQLSPADAADAVERVALDDLLRRSDVVTLHPRVTPETTGMIGAEALAAMKPGSVLVNTARGAILNEAALCDALGRGHLRGAMLDTFAQEPPAPDSPLLRLPNVTLTPHVAGASQRTVRRAAAQIAEDIRRWLQARPLLNRC